MGSRYMRCIHLWGKGLMSTYHKDHRVSVFLHLVDKFKLYLLQLQSSCTCFLKVSATFRMTVEDVDLGFLMDGLCPGAAGSAGRCIWSALASPHVSSYSTRAYWMAPLTQFCLAPCFAPALIIVPVILGPCTL